MTAPGLKPCPFCGSQVHLDRGEKGVATINCAKGSTCIGSGLLMGFMIEDEATAVDQWNTRADLDLTVKVKPLEWVEIRANQFFEARVIGILYSVRLGTDGVIRWQAGHMGTWFEADTIEAAKAAAQADYEARIREALQ